jgi:hypothetical protein
VSIRTDSEIVALTNLAHTSDPLHNCGSVAIHRSVLASFVYDLTAQPAFGRHKSQWPGKQGEAELVFVCPRHRAEVA